MDFSLPGLIGGAVGIVIGVINYGVIVTFLEKRLRALDKSQSAQERADFEHKISLLRRIVLAAEVIMFAAIGYWFGWTIGG
jgi:predicted DNA-binding transcriptional regulator